MNAGGNSMKNVNWVRKVGLSRNVRDVTFWVYVDPNVKEIDVWQMCGKRGEFYIICHDGGEYVIKVKKTFKGMQVIDLRIL